MRTRSLFVGVIVGLVVGLAVSVSMTIADWRLNPSEIFHNEHGTDWAVVLETLASWFWPVSLAAFVLAAVVHYCVTRIRAR